MAKAKKKDVHGRVFDQVLDAVHRKRAERLQRYAKKPSPTASGGALDTKNDAPNMSDEEIEELKRLAG